MKFPCEIILWYILPGVRSELAKELVKKGLTQREVSDKLGITQASVSYYLTKKRGAGIKFSKNISQEIKKLAKDIANGKEKNLNQRICEICKLVQKDKTLCKVHKKVEKVPKGCNVCLI